MSSTIENNFFSADEINHWIVGLEVVTLVLSQSEQENRRVAHLEQRIQRRDCTCSEDQIRWQAAARYMKRRKAVRWARVALIAVAANIAVNIIADLVIVCFQLDWQTFFLRWIDSIFEGITFINPFQGIKFLDLINWRELLSVAGCTVLALFLITVLQKRQSLISFDFSGLVLDEMRTRRNEVLKEITGTCSKK